MSTSLSIQSRKHGFIIFLFSFVIFPSESAAPSNIKMSLVAPLTVNMTWDPPAKLFGNYAEYVVRCRHVDGYENIESSTRHTYYVISNVTKGNLSCGVLTETFVNADDSAMGPISELVSIGVPSAGE